LCPCEIEDHGYWVTVLHTSDRINPLSLCRFGRGGEEDACPFPESIEEWRDLNARQPYSWWSDDPNHVEGMAEQHSSAVLFGEVDGEGERMLRRFRSIDADQ